MKRDDQRPEHLRQRLEEAHLGQHVERARAHEQAVGDYDPHVAFNEVRDRLVARIGGG